ncbi:hypothetical protein T4C_10768 [Trichinella pseudospiralis]|uniref:Uncharacterized protein n=1 Tax=Trichinella pseudospiralis TaxID=6337 RepID=A0A0V1GEY8_TRIPS|nr:hypothetical protein T4C_10768 [Trichinella pseudospiralis]
MNFYLISTQVPLAQPHKIITQKKSFLPLLICFSSKFRP